MNQKQKCFYTALGAVIMLIGMGVGATLCPPLIAQKRDVLGEIQCTSLTVVNTSGTPAIVLRADETLGNGFVIYNSAGIPAVLLVADETGNSIAVVDKSGEPAVLLRASELANRIIIRNPSGKDGVRLSAGNVANRVTVYNPEETNAVQLYADESDESCYYPQIKWVSSGGKHHSDYLNRTRIGVYLWISEDTPPFFMSDLP